MLNLSEFEFKPAYPQIQDGAYCSLQDYAEWNGKKKFGIRIGSNHQRCPEALLFLPLIPNRFLFRNGCKFVGIVHEGRFLGTYEGEKNE